MSKLSTLALAALMMAVGLQFSGSQRAEAGVINDIANSALNSLTNNAAPYPEYAFPYGYVQPQNRSVLGRLADSVLGTNSGGYYANNPYLGTSAYNRYGVNPNSGFNLTNLLNRNNNQFLPGYGYNSYLGYNQYPYQQSIKDQIKGAVTRQVIKNIAGRIF